MWDNRDLSGQCLRMYQPVGNVLVLVESYIYAIKGSENMTVLQHQIRVSIALARRWSFLCVVVLLAFGNFCSYLTINEIKWLTCRIKWEMKRLAQHHRNKFSIWSISSKANLASSIYYVGEQIFGQVRKFSDLCTGLFRTVKHAKQLFWTWQSYLHSRGRTATTTSMQPLRGSKQNLN